MNHLTPKQIVAELDKYIVGQSDAKRAVAVAIRNRWRRQQLPEGMRKDCAPKNIIMVGPTGVGKTEIARRLAGLTGAPFIKVEATKYTEVGYHGRDVESMVRDLLDVSIAMVSAEHTETVRTAADAQVEDRMLDLLLPKSSGFEDEESKEKRARTREKLREQLKVGLLEDREVEITTEEKANVAGLLGSAGMELGADFESMFERMMPSKRETHRYRVADARKVLLSQEAEKLVEKDTIIRTAIERAEQSGIIFLDEIDKICGSEKSDGPDVSRQGVQRDLLPVVEGSTVISKHGPVKTDHILFIAAGAFHTNKPTDLMPELQGRFPIRVELQDLTRDDFFRILTEPENSLIKQTISLMATEGIELDIRGEAIYAMAQVAFDTNKKTQNIGARRLHTILEKVFEEISYSAADTTEKHHTITADYVKQHLAGASGEKGRGWFL